MKNENYKSNFLAALERSRKFGLSCPNFSYSNKEIINNHFLQRLIQKLGKLNPELIVGKCLQMSCDAQFLIGSDLKQVSYLTIGNVRDTENGKYIWHQTESQLFSSLEFGPKPNESIKFHAWLTFPSLEILDLTIASSICRVQKKKAFGGILYGSASKFPQFEYIPMLVVSQFHI